METLGDLRTFMAHHVFSVWDFMSLLKYLQAEVAPAGSPWVPGGGKGMPAGIQRFINELVLEEESDETPVEGKHLSHFELYQEAMREISAPVESSEAFVAKVRNEGISSALNSAYIPAASRAFTQKTFEFIQNDRAHEVAAALAFGREHIIPTMFRAILAKTGVGPQTAPAFYFYLERHIHLDEGSHAGLSLELLNVLCEGNEDKIHQAQVAAKASLEARIALWDGVLEALTQQP